MWISNKLWARLRVIKTIKDLTPEEQDEIISLLRKSNGAILLKMPQPERFYNLAVAHSPASLKYMTIQNEFLCLAAVTRFPEALDHVHHQTHDLCLISLRAACDRAAMKMDEIRAKIENFEHGGCFSKDDWIRIIEPVIAISNEPLKYIRYNTRDFWSKAIDINPYVIAGIKDPDHQLCLQAIQACPYVLGFLSRQTVTMIKTAVKTLGVTLSLANYQTEEICEIAVLQSHHAIHFVKRVTPRIKKIAVMSMELQYRRALKQMQLRNQK